MKATTAENVDIKEGTRNGLIKGNMFVGDWTNTQLVGPYDSDDSNIDMKGSYWKVKDNYMYNSKKIGLPYYNPHFRYFVEEVVMRGDNVKKYENAMGYYVTADNYAQNGWCDNSSGDKNECLEADNKIVESIEDMCVNPASSLISPAFKDAQGNSILSSCRNKIEVTSKKDEYTIFKIYFYDISDYLSN